MEVSSEKIGGVICPPHHKKKVASSMTGSPGKTSAHPFAKTVAEAFGQEDAINEKVDPGEYGMENFSCRAVCLFLFTLSVMHEMLAEVQSFSVALAVVAVVAEAVAVVSLPAVIAVTVLLPKLLPLQALLLSVMLWLWLLVLYVVIRYCFLLLLVFFDYCCWIAVFWASLAATTVKRPPHPRIVTCMKMALLLWNVLLGTSNGRNLEFLGFVACFQSGNI